MELKADPSFQKKLKRQESHLMKLMETAVEGNEISSMIWRNLDRETKKTKRTKKEVIIVNEDS